MRAYKNSDTALRLVKKPRKKLRRSSTFYYTVQFFYNPIGATQWLATAKSAQKPQHIPHIMSHGTPTSTPAKDSTSHAMDMILRASEYTPTCLETMPVEKADQHTATHQPTASQLARLTLHSTPPEYSLCYNYPYPNL